jgi:S1-C subfamily serine protease
MTQLISNGKLEPGRIGIGGRQEITPDLAKQMKLPDTHGALINQVVPGSPADKAGMKVGDVIVEVNSKQVRDFPQLRTMIGILPIGEKVRVKYYRGGKPYEVSMVIAKPAEDSGRDVSPRLKGATFGQVKKGGNIEGVEVTATEPGSPAAHLFRKGDVIVSVNYEPVSNVENLRTILSAIGDQPMLLQIQRGEVSLFITLQ